MHVGREDRVRMERAHVAAWPALHTATIDGWLWRSSGGGSQRANSVSTIDYTGRDLNASIDFVEARYLAIEQPTRFQTFDHSSPVGLADALLRRAYIQGDTTLTMLKRVSANTMPARVESRDYAWEDWCDVYMAAISEDRRAVNRRILAAIPQPCRYFACHLDGRIIATALCVVNFGCAVVECVATRPDGRRRGGAAAVMAGLLSWASRQDADLVGLQVVATNVPAVRLYETLNFVPGATNRFWLNCRSLNSHRQSW